MLRDKFVNSLTGRNVETVAVTLEQIVELLKKAYISQVNIDEEYNAIIKTIKGGVFKDKELTSKDGKYEIRCSTGRRASLFNLKNRNLLWIYDKEADKFYEYRAYSFRKLRKQVKQVIASSKANI